MKPAPMIQCPKCSAQNPPDSRFCTSCGQPLSSPSQMPTMEAPAAEAQKAAETPHVARIISSDSIPAGGFTPGTILADRYRIIGLLGRGGMGEVYRADDLKLGQPVALKFLPPKLADDPVRRERFFAEVRITRQLSHPEYLPRLRHSGDRWTAFPLDGIHRRRRPRIAAQAHRASDERKGSGHRAAACSRTCGRA